MGLEGKGQEDEGIGSYSRIPHFLATPGSFPEPTNSPYDFELLTMVICLKDIYGAKERGHKNVK